MNNTTNNTMSSDRMNHITAMIFLGVTDKTMCPTIDKKIVERLENKIIRDNRKMVTGR